MKRLIDANELEKLFYKQIACGATDLMDAFDFALEDAQTIDAVEEVRWIPVTERLPEDYTARVLVKIKDGNSIIGHPNIDTDRYLPGLCGWARWGDCVTHWMPLPEPPKECEA